MTAIEAFKKGFAIAKELMILMGILVGFNVITSGIVVGIIGINPTTERVAELAAPMVGLSMFIMLAWIVLEGGVFSTIYMKIKSNDTQLDMFAGNCFKFFPRLLGLGFLSGVISLTIWFVGALITAIFVAMGQGTNPFFNVLGLIVFGVAVIFSFILIMPMLMGHYLIIIEDSKIIASLKKGISLFKQNWGRIIVLFILITLVVVVISLISNLLSALLSNIMPGVVGTVLQVVLSACVNGGISVFSSACIMVMVLSLLTPVAAPISSAPPVSPVEPPPVQPLV